MTDKEKMQSVLNYYGDREPNFIEIIVSYLIKYKPTLYEWLQFDSRIHTMYHNTVSEVQKSVGIARENAYYVERYLKGELYINEEQAKQHLPLQIEHIEKVVKLLDEEK